MILNIVLLCLTIMNRYSHHNDTLFIQNIRFEAL